MSMGRVVRRFIHYLVSSEISEGNSKNARFRKCIFKILYFEFYGGLGSIPGELSFAANSRELGRTRANSRELRANSPTVRQYRHSAELRRTFAGVRRTFAGVRRSSPGFARVRPYSAANWRTVRQKIRSREEIHPLLTSVRRERVRRELGSRRT